MSRTPLIDLGPIFEEKNGKVVRCRETRKLELMLNSLSDRELSLLEKMRSGKSYFEHIDVWNDLSIHGVIRWSRGQERHVLTARGKRLQEALGAGIEGGEKG